MKSATFSGYLEAHMTSARIRRAVAVALAAVLCLSAACTPEAEKPASHVVILALDAGTWELLDRYIARLTGRESVDPGELAAIDGRIAEEIDRATDEAERSPPPEPRDCLNGVYADPPAMPALWYREGIRSAVDRHERPASWGTHDG